MNDWDYAEIRQTKESNNDYEEKQST